MSMALNEAQSQRWASYSVLIFILKHGAEKGKEEEDKLGRKAQKLTLFSCPCPLRVGDTWQERSEGVDGAGS